ncbi:hypothetical protein D3C85_1318250 [compost metagenome]
MVYSSLLSFYKAELLEYFLYSDYLPDAELMRYPEVQVPVADQESLPRFLESTNTFACLPVQAIH